MTDTYNEQIEALLNGDFNLFKKILRANPEVTIKTNPQVRPKWNIYSIREAWNITGRVPGSLFEALPNLPRGLCASTVQYKPYLTDSKALEMLESSKVSLPDLLSNKTYHFSREELEEFARRQRYIRGLLDVETGEIIPDHCGVGPEHNWVLVTDGIHERCIACKHVRIQP